MKDTTAMRGCGASLGIVHSVFKRTLHDEIVRLGGEAFD